MNISDFDKETNFINELKDLINKHSKENYSNTPDFILAEYMSDCLRAFERASRQRESWYGIALEIGGPRKKFIQDDDL